MNHSTGSLWQWNVNTALQQYQNYRLFKSQLHVQVSEGERVAPKKGDSQQIYHS